MTNSNETSSDVKYMYILATFFIFLGYIYWWLTRPTEKRMSSIEIETPSPTNAPTTIKQDDLTKIKGIGPKIAEAFYSKGIRQYSQIALMSEADLRKFLSKAGIRISNPSTWPQQAGLAALGKWEQLEELQG